jgi:hypothetical protein
LVQTGDACKCVAPTFSYQELLEPIDEVEARAAHRDGLIPRHVERRNSSLRLGMTRTAQHAQDSRRRRQRYVSSRSLKFNTFNTFNTFYAVIGKSLVGRCLRKPSR